MSADPFEGFELAERIRARAARIGIALDRAACESLATHARAVLARPELHLTSIVDPETFLERHMGEALEGAALLEDGIQGLHVDLGSGNGYPALPVNAARAGLASLLTEASAAKAAYLEEMIGRAGFTRASVLGRQVQRPADLPSEEPVSLLTCRAMGAWPKIVPRLASCLARGAHVLIWCGEELEAVARREVWRRLKIERAHPLPERERSFVWHLRPAP
jgi:16S rRNA (guanine527-N7)-methyltransferase